MLSRTVEDASAVTSPLVPWNSCGAYMAGALQVPTVEYLPRAFSNLINPLLAILFGVIGLRTAETSSTQGQETALPVDNEQAGSGSG